MKLNDFSSFSFEHLKKDLSFWLLHQSLNAGSTSVVLSSVERVGKWSAQFKSTRDRQWMNTLHAFQYAHHLDVMDLKYRIQNLQRQVSFLHDEVSDLYRIVDGDQ